MGGLLAARVLSDYFEQVTIVDRDTFPTKPDHRKGVPQSYHAHALLAAGQYIIEQLFPGILDDLRTGGALSLSDVVSFVFVTAAGKLPALRQPGEFIAFSRYLLEWHVRDRLSQQPGIRILPNTEGIRLVSTPDHSRVTGVEVRERGQMNTTEILHADLVVDASGRHSQAPQWLTELGYEAPPEEIINSGLGYASRFYAKPENFPDEWQGLIINGRPPYNARAGLILPVDNGRWHVSLGGFAGHFPPTDEEGFLQWARDLPDPSIYEALRIAQPLTPIRGYRTPENRLRHFERLQRWPAGLIVTGDAVCAFNPIYGQGMTVSALDAMTLNACLQEQQHSPKSNFEQHLQQKLSTTVADAWLVATSEDLRWPGVTLRGSRPAPTLGLLHRYMDIVLYSAVEDPQITQAYISVITMMNPPNSLARPTMLVRVLRSAIKRILKRVFTRKHETASALSSEALHQLRALPEIHYEQVS
jgi:2-polyprenyl-6-methoxyphenol hydroxylase-like FAD-dependent oxidoreductase